MCGRYTYLYKWKQLHRLMTLTTPPFEFKERYNVVPTNDAPVVRADEHGGRTLSMLRWGLVPFWAKDLKIGYSTINARAETVASAPAFRAAFKRGRCLVPVSGFYEWKKLEDGKRKQPYYITPADGEPIALAGLWDSWKSPEGKVVETFTIITTKPNEMIAKLHDRMPVILDPHDFARWLDAADEGSDAVRSLLKPYPAELMVAHAVSTCVNTPKNDDVQCIQPLPE